MSGKNKHFLISLSQNKGALLVEIMLTVALFTILSMSIAAMLLVSGVLYRTNDAHARVNENARQGIMTYTTHCDRNESFVFSPRAKPSAKVSPD